MEIVIDGVSYQGHISPSCRSCDAPVEARYAGRECYDCSRLPRGAWSNVDRVLTAMPYARPGDFGEANAGYRHVWNLKDGRFQAQMLRFFEELMVKRLLQEYPGTLPFDLVTSAPGSRSSPWDQARGLAETIATRIGLPYVALLRKADDAKARHLATEEKGRGEDNIGVSVIRDCDGKGVLFVDDSMIHGDTLRDCANKLRANGAASIVGLIGVRQVERWVFERIGITWKPNSSAQFRSAEPRKGQTSGTSPSRRAAPQVDEPSLLQNAKWVPPARIQPRSWILSRRSVPATDGQVAAWLTIVAQDDCVEDEEWGSGRVLSIEMRDGRWRVGIEFPERTLWRDLRNWSL